MKLHLDNNPALNTITGYGEGYVEVNRQRHAHPILLQPEGEILRWASASFDALARAHFDAVLALQPEILLIGTGPRQRFPHPALTADLMTARIGVEAMDTGAACRTYNILMSEGRKVVAVLLHG